MTTTLTDLIRDTGTTAFPAVLFRYWRKIFAFRQLTGWHMAPGHAPITLVAERPGDKEKVEGLCQIWATGDFASDAVFNEADTSLTLARVTLADISDDDYRSRFFTDAGLSGKLSVCQKLDSGTWYLNFYRFMGEPAFTSEDEQALRTHWDIALACLEKHTEILRDKGDIPTSGDLFPALSAFFCHHAAGLSHREAETCAYAILGHTHESIALNLGVSKSTAMTFRNRAYTKLGATGISDLFTLYLSRQ